MGKSNVYKVTQKHWYEMKDYASTSRNKEEFIVLKSGMLNLGQQTLK